MKPRNHIVIALLKSNRVGGAHRKANKAIRRSEKVKLQQYQQDRHTQD